ncbi:MAG: histidine phosphatase family protein [Candidatus Nomurabacteria bacterium]|nr:histidine phosphatase family protein [Candidatus Nomurabacteria bacterium]USN87727.1 MAG: histidine phosphatase family protein [Candidatus Nomurabacteria bacterium]
MDVYLIRHGETDGNVARRHQHDKTDINEIGTAQTKAIAKAIKRINPTHIVTSTNLRAVETAKLIIITCELDLIPETSTAFEEIRRPSWLIGSSHFSLISAQYMWHWFFDYKLKGEMETYTPFLGRIIEAKRYLESLPDDARVVVVSHSVFINIFLEHLCVEKRMSFWRAMKRLWKVFTMPNTSMIHLRHVHSEGGCHWEIVSDRVK